MTRNSSGQPISPLQPRLGAVFVHVTDMSRAITWYSRLLGLPEGDTSHAGLIYDLPMEGTTGLTLDGHAHARGKFQPSILPVLTLWADDIHTTLHFVSTHSDHVTAIEDIGTVSVFHFQDLDGNRLIAMAMNLDMSAQVPVRILRWHHRSRSD